MTGAWTPRAVVVGSGLAGLSCAERMARQGHAVTVLSAGRLGRDGATHRVHALAPWILLTAPWVRGDSPAAFSADLIVRADGQHREGLPETYAENANRSARELAELLDLEAFPDSDPVVLPGDHYPRGRRFLPRRRDLLLAPIIQQCRDAGVRFYERTLAVALGGADGRVSSVAVIDRITSSRAVVPADVVVLACGGVGGVFPLSTVPRWCRGSGLALGSDAGAILHRPGLTQALPVTATPPLYFPTTAALLSGRLLIDGEPAPACDSLDAATLMVADALRGGLTVTLDAEGEAAEVLPPRVRASAAFRQGGRIPLAVALHHAIGGIAIDAWGRTSIAGLYACGESAGGVQGRWRMMGTGLLEARIFAVRAAAAAARDIDRLGPVVQRREVRWPSTPIEPAAYEERMDTLLGPLARIRPEPEIRHALTELAAWPSGPTGAAADKSFAARIRADAAKVLLDDSLAHAAAPCRRQVTAASEVAREVT